MSQSQQEQTNNRGAMALEIRDLEAFARKWADAEGQTVQHWELWEQAAVRFFEHQSANTEILHAVMQIVVALCTGTPFEVKRALRDAAPSTLAICNVFLAHLPQFNSVIDAEQRFRQRMLACDWSMVPDGDGRLTVRTVYRRASGETEH